MSTQLTIADLQTALPAQVKAKVTQELVNTFNSITSDDEFKEHYRNNLISDGSVMQDGRFTVDQYLNAVRYVSYKLMGDTNIKAYMRSFPTKYSKFKQQGVRDKDIASYVSAYNKSKLVNLIWEQSMIPTHVLNADMFQDALNIQMGIMTDTSVSPKVRSDAANSLLTHLKPPEKKKLEIEVSHKTSSVIDDLRRATQEHAKVLKDGIASGHTSVTDVAQADLILDAEYEEVNE